MRTVLIIDDEELILSLLAEGLRIFLDGWNILTAGNGKEAIAILDSVPVDFIVTDINMPEMDGYELLAFARERRPSARLVVMTADYSPDVRRRLRSLGVPKCFEKPFSLKDLAAEITEAFCAGCIPSAVSNAVA